MNNTTTSQTETRGAQPPDTPLVRPRAGRVIAGVAAGLAARLGIGVGWVRTGFVIACFFGGLGFLLYILGWLAIPEEGEEDSIAATRIADLEGSTRWIGIGLIVLGGLLVLGWTSAVSGQLVWAAAFVLLGILLYKGELPFKRQSAAGAPVTIPAPPPPPEAGSAEETTAGDTLADVPAESDEGEEESAAEAATLEIELPPTTPPPPPPVGQQPKRARARRSMLGRFTLAAMLLVIGAIALLDNAGVVEPSARHYVGAVVGLAGLGLILGAWWGRARALIAIGVLLLPVLLIASVIRVPFSGEFGEKSFRPASVVDLRDEYRLGAGDLRIDLSNIDVAGATIGFEATVGAGRLTVIVPAGPAVAVDARVGFGELEVLGFVTDGVGREITIPPQPGAAGLLDIAVEVGFGQVQVLRAEK